MDSNSRVFKIVPGSLKSYVSQEVARGTPDPLNSPEMLTQ